MNIANSKCWKLKKKNLKILERKKFNRENLVKERN
jgi:hypothetical protein